MEKPVRIVRLEAENFKRLQAVQITPDGALVPICGRNAQGKSSVLDAIEAALGGKKSVPARAVRDGEERARVVLELDDLVVTRTFTAAGGTSLKVESKDGARYGSPQAMLDRLVGELSFDPLGFARMDGRARVEMLRRLLGVDLGPIETERQEAYEERTLVNRTVKRLEAQLASMPPASAEPLEEVSVGDLARELEQAQRRHDQHAQAKSELERTRRAVSAAEERARAKREEIARLQRELGELEGKIEAGRGAVGELERRIEAEAADLPDLAVIRQRIASAEEVNAAARESARRKEVEAEIDGSRAMADALTAKIDELDERKRAAIAAAELPVDGLGFDESGVTLNGLPFDQASGAEKLRVSVAMGLALNPRLKVLLIRDGSLLDEDSLRMIAEMAEKAGAQVWLEKVTDGRGVGVVIEDGMLRGADAEAAE